MTLDEVLVKEISSIVGEGNCSTRIADLYTYGFDSSIHHHTPDIVVRPRTAAEISELVKLAGQEAVMTPRAPSRRSALNPHGRD